jgi:hypothetical protein
MQKLGGSCACNDAWSLYNCTTDHTEAWRCRNGTLQEEKCTGPAGCVVKPVGQNDFCDTSHAFGAGFDPADGAAAVDVADPGDGGGSGEAMTPQHESSGCSASGSDGGLFALLVACRPLTRSRRSARGYRVGRSGKTFASR